MLNKYFGSKRPFPQDDTIGEPVAPKKKKRTSVTGFDKADLPKRIDSWKKNPPAGDWGNISEIKVSYTVYQSGVLFLVVKVIFNKAAVLRPATLLRKITP